MTRQPLRRVYYRLANDERLVLHAAVVRFQQMLVLWQMQFG